MRQQQLQLANLCHRASLLRWPSQKMDAARESLECHEHHCVNQNAQLDEKLVEIALRKHRVQLVDVAHLLGPFQSQ